MQPDRLDVRLDARTYPVWVGAATLDRFVELVPPPPRARNAMVVVDEGVAAALPDAVASIRRSLADAGIATAVVSVAGETAKEVRSVEVLWREMAAAGLHRGDLLVTIGGGVTSDLGGFAAATYHRGIAWIAVPTTLLAMVDAAIGGKTGVNIPEGKNLAGSFHQPLGVIADVTTLETLPDADLTTGLAEVIKHGLIARPGLLEVCRDRLPQIHARDAAVLRELVRDAAAVKVAIVSEDETEQGARMFLNYGHTLGHALEALGGYERWSHGEAVSIGMMFAATLARLLGYGDTVDTHREHLRAAGLPVAGADDDFDDLRRVMAGDKKATDGLRFVLLEAVGEPVVVGGIGDDLLRAAYAAVRAEEPLR